MHYFINIARNKLKFVCLKLRLTQVFNFKWRCWQPCRWLSGTNNCVKAHVGDVIIVWRNTHDNTEPNAIWFPATLTDTDLNIHGIQVKYRTIGNCNIPATESRLWGTKWYHLFSAQVRMLRRGAFGIFYTRWAHVGPKNFANWDLLLTSHIIDNITRAWRSTFWNFIRSDWN